MNNRIYIIAIILIGCGQSSDIAEVDRKVQDTTLDEMDRQQKEIEEMKKGLSPERELVVPEPAW